MSEKHSFHIPVMGIGYTIDTPLKVSQYGIDSVISLVDDILIEKMRMVYCENFEIPYKMITEKIEDFRAKRITSYLNLIKNLAVKKFEELKNATVDKVNEIKKCFSMLPDCSSIKQEFIKLTSKNFNIDEIKNWLKDNLSMGSIDVNIMTKLDKANYVNGEQLPEEYNDAHAALRGFANSDLESSVVLSAGINPNLYTYLESFDDFYPDENGKIKKKIILKVSDYRSAMIQGKFLARKGLWVSEFRVESGLNCGGHAFATKGFLLGPILEEFKDKREQLVQTLHKICVKSLSGKKRSIPKKELSLKVTAQGGVGTAEEHRLLLDYYKVDSVGWGSPFLLVPEVTSMDEPTLMQLIKAKEEDLYLSNISPLDVYFNNLRNNTKDLEKLSFIKKGTPGSVCTKRFLALNNDFTEKSVCKASRQYQTLKIKELEKQNLSPEKYQAEYKKIVEKSCICVGLGITALNVNNLDTKSEGAGISVCPGQNLAYFSKEMTLEECTDHIYGRANVISRTDRPNMFVKELQIYLDFLKDKIKETRESLASLDEKYFVTFVKNLKEGIDYYCSLFTNMKDVFKDGKSELISDLAGYKKTLESLNSEIEALIATVKKEAVEAGV